MVPASLIIFLAYLIVWVLTLADVLQRTEFDPITRLTWVIVVISVPLVGIILYAALKPWVDVKSDKRKLNSLSGTPWENNPGHRLKR